MDILKEVITNSLNSKNLKTAPKSKMAGNHGQ